MSLLLLDILKKYFQKNCFCFNKNEYARCLVSTSKSCTGMVINEDALLIAEHMIVDKKTNVCPDHDIEGLENLIKCKFRHKQ